MPTSPVLPYLQLLSRATQTLSLERVAGNARLSALSSGSRLFLASFRGLYEGLPTDQQVDSGDALIQAILAL